MCLLHVAVAHVTHGTFGDALLMSARSYASHDPLKLALKMRVDLCFFLLNVSPLAQLPPIFC